MKPCKDCISHCCCCDCGHDKEQCQLCFDEKQAFIRIDEFKFCPLTGEKLED